MAPDTAMRFPYKIGIISLGIYRGDRTLCDRFTPLSLTKAMTINDRKHQGYKPPDSSVQK